MFDADQNAVLPMDTLKIMQFSYTKIINFPDNCMSFNEINNSDTPR